MIKNSMRTFYVVLFMFLITACQNKTVGEEPTYNPQPVIESTEEIPPNEIEKGSDEEGENDEVETKIALPLTEHERVNSHIKVPTDTIDYLYDTHFINEKQGYVDLYYIEDNQVLMKRIENETEVIFSCDNPLPADEIPFDIVSFDNSILVGVNCNSGVKVYYIILDTDMKLTLQEGKEWDILNSMEGKKIHIIEDSFYAIEGIKDTNKELIFLSRYGDPYTIPFKNELVNIELVQGKNQLIVENENNDRLNFRLINGFKEDVWNMSYDLEDNETYSGLIWRTPSSFYICISGDNSKFILFNLDDEEAVAEYKTMQAFGQVFSDYNTFYLIGKDQENQDKSIYLCNRNFKIIDSFDFTSYGLIEVSDIGMDLYEDKVFLNARLKDEDETYCVMLNLSETVEDANLIELNEEHKLTTLGSNHLFKLNYFSVRNFEGIQNVINIPTSYGDIHYFIYNHSLYKTYSTELIDKINKEVDVGSNYMMGIEIGDNCYAFYEGGKYKFVDHLDNNIDIEKFYDSALAGSEEPLDMCIRSNGETIMIDTQSLFSISYTNGKTILNDNINDIIESMDYLRLLEGEGYILIYNSDNVYRYSFDTRELIWVETPTNNKKDGARCTEKDGTLYWDNNYYDPLQNRFISMETIHRPQFKGGIRGNYYYPQDEYGEIATDKENIIIYETPYVELQIGEEKMEICHYYKKDNSEYIINSSNMLYKIIDETGVKLTGKEVRIYDIAGNDLVYSGFVPNEKLYHLDLSTQDEIQIYDKEVLDIHIDGEKVIFLSGYDYNLYVYHMTTNETQKITNDDGVIQVAYTDDVIAYEGRSNQINIMDKNTYLLMNSYEGGDMKFNPFTKDVYYKCGAMLLRYNMLTGTNEVLAHAPSYIIDFLDDEVVGDDCMDGPLWITMLDGFGSWYSYEEEHHDISDQHAITVAPVMYGVCFYIYEKDTLIHHYLGMYGNKTHVYYDDQFVYYLEPEKEENWLKYDLFSGETTILEDFQADDLKVIEGVPGKA